MDTAPLLGPGPVVVAIDVGGTGISAGLFSDDGSQVAHIGEPTARSRQDPAGTVISQVKGILDALARKSPGMTPEVVGLSIPGIVDENSGVGVFSSNLGWRNAPMKQLAEETLALPIAFGHDVRAACLAEYEIGAARGARDALILTIGTGIAAGIIVNGDFAVAGGYAGEIGHMSLTPAGPPCTCGARGCLEQIASASAIAGLYREQTGKTVTGAREVRDLADGGDEAALAIWQEATDALARALAQITAVLSPEVVVIGGGLSRAGESLLAPVRRRLSELLSFHRMPRIVPALLRDDAGLLGSAIRARRHAREMGLS